MIGIRKSLCSRPLASGILRLETGKDLRPPLVLLTDNLHSTPTRNVSIIRRILLTVKSAWFQQPPKLVGVDEHGNRFFEVPPNLSSEHSFKSKYPRRYVLLPGQSSVDDSWMTLSGDLPVMSPEWTSWLYHRRAYPPKAEEIAANAAAAQRRVELASELEAKYEAARSEMVRQGLIRDNRQSNNSMPEDRYQERRDDTFPVYPELEISPGEGHMEVNANKDHSKR